MLEPMSVIVKDSILGYVAGVTKFLDEHARTW